MTRDLARRISDLDSRVPVRCQQDLSHLSDRQLELLEGCIDRRRGEWDREKLAALSEADADALCAALRSLSSEGSRELRAATGLASPIDNPKTPRAAQLKAERDRLVAAASQREAS